MADIILLIALVIHYYYFTRRARAIRKAWRGLAPLLEPRLNQQPPIVNGFAPRGLDEPDGRELMRPALGALRQRMAEWTGMPPHALRGLSVTIEFGPYRRRVRLLSLTDDPDATQRLDVYCFERQAIRRFPVARLLRVIDPAGHVFVGRSFLDAALALRAKPGPSLQALEGVPQGAALLIAVALQKGELDETVRRAVSDFAHGAARAESYRHSDPLVQSLDAYVMRLRPDLRSVREALGWTMRQQDPYQRRLLAALRALDREGAFATAFVAIEAALDRPKPW
jgi:hypothetical protein